VISWLAELGDLAISSISNSDYSESLWGVVDGIKNDASSLPVLGVRTTE
jgi:hypothetical protein